MKISRRTLFCIFLVASPFAVFPLAYAVCWTWPFALKPGASEDTYLDWCGHDAIIPHVAIGGSLVLAIFGLLLLPISLFLDWRKWKTPNR